MQRINFNENWKYWKDNDPFELVFSVPAEARDVTVPHDAMFSEEQAPDSVNGGSTGFIDGGEYKYYKSFFVPEAYAQGKVLLHFEGVYSHASVFVNQSLAGENAFGYTEFFVELQDYLKFGEENEILVTVKCGARNSRWYSGAGIYRDIWLLHSPAVRVKPGSLRFTTLDLQPDGAAVSVEAELCNDGLTAENLFTTIAVREENGPEVCRHTYPVRVKGGQQLSLRKNLFLENVELWGEDTPALYRITVTAADENGCEIDSEQTVSGIRKLTLDSRHGLRVNGKTVKLRGACLHHDQSILGAATYFDYEYRRVKRLKEAGFNAVRSAHNHASQALLTACDRLGVFVMDELVDVWNKSKKSYDYSIDFAHSWEKDVEAMVTADYNHPSVVLYSTGNEIFEIATEKGIEVSRMLGEKFHQLDPTRYTTNGINGAFAAGDGLAQIVKDLTGEEPGKGDVNVFMGMMATQMPAITKHKVVGGILERLETTMDVLGYNYMTARYLPDTEKYPDRLMVGSETYPKQIAENWAAITKSPAVLGDFTWTGWDYLGEVMPPFPNLTSLAGDITSIGVRRPVSYYREIVFGLKKGPVIAVQNPARYGCDRNFGPWQYTDCTFNYTYPGAEGKPIMVQVYAGGDTVELFQNGSSLGKQPCGRETEFEAQYNTTYQPGELVAVAYEKGVEIGRNVLQTAGEVDKIYVNLETGDSLVFANVELRDSEGRRAFRNDTLALEITGPAKLLAFGSETARHDHGFSHCTTTAADGCALAILRRTGTGEIGLKVISDRAAVSIAISD